MTGKTATDQRPYGSDGQFLRQAGIFHDVNDVDLQALVAGTYYRAYARGELITWVEEERETVLLVGDGSVRLYRLSHTGDEITLAHLQTGDIFGLAFLERALTPKSALEATVDGTMLCRIPLKLFLRFIASRPAITSRVIALHCHWLMEAYNLVEELAFESVKSRVAHVLARLAGTDKHFRVSMTRKELAALAGTRQEEVTRVLRHFRDQGLVAYKSHQRGIVVVDPYRLGT